MRETESIICVSLWKIKLYGARCWAGLLLILQRKLWNRQEDAIAVVSTTKHGVPLILRFSVLFSFFLYFLFVRAG